MTTDPRLDEYKHVDGNMEDIPIEPIHEDYEPIIKSLVKATALRRAGLNVLEDDELDMAIAEIARIKPLPIVCVPTGDRP